METTQTEPISQAMVVAERRYLGDRVHIPGDTYTGGTWISDQQTGCAATEKHRFAQHRTQTSSRELKNFNIRMGR
jgi:hypothetical protein